MLLLFVYTHERTNDISTDTFAFISTLTQAHVNWKSNAIACCVHNVESIEFQEYVLLMQMNNISSH